MILGMDIDIGYPYADGCWDWYGLLILDIDSGCHNGYWISGIDLGIRWYHWYWKSILISDIGYGYVIGDWCWVWILILYVHTILHTGVDIGSCCCIFIRCFWNPSGRMPVSDININTQCKSQWTISICYIKIESKHNINIPHQTIYHSVSNNNSIIPYQNEYPISNINMECQHPMSDLNTQYKWAWK